MKKFLTLLIVANSVFWGVSAQNQEPILVIDNKLEVYADEFVREYGQFTDGYVSEDLPSLIERYADYRLQIYDAEQRRLDTAASVRAAREYYQNYLVTKHIAEGAKAKKIISQLVSECGTQYRVEHIQVNINTYQPADTAAAYYKAEKIRTRLLSGADFALTARQLSDDPSANFNGGDLGYISVLEMPSHSFAQYVKSHVNSNEISTPILCAKAYHIIKVSESRPAVDSVTVSCIEIRKTKKRRTDDSLYLLANQICEKIKSGEDFASLQKKHSYQQGSQKLALFEAVARYGAQLNNLKYSGNAYDKPFDTYDSYLIVKLEKLHPRSADRNMEEVAKSRFLVSDSYKELTDQFIDSVKTVSGYSAPNDYGGLTKAIDETIFDGEWVPQDGLTLIDDQLFTFGGRSYSIGDFAKYIYENQKPCNTTSIKLYLDNKIKEMTDQLALGTAPKMLLRRYPQYQSLIHEYTFPILYSLADKYNKTEQKAENYSDVEEYYKKNSLNYLSGYSLYLRIFEPVEGASPKKVMKAANEISGDIARMPDRALLKPVAADTFQLGQNPVADIVIRGFNSAEYSYPADKVIKLAQHNSIVTVKVLEEPHPVELSQIFTQVSNEYRKTLKSEYVRNLRQKYDLKISKDAESILKELF